MEKAYKGITNDFWILSNYIKRSICEWCDENGVEPINIHIAVNQGIDEFLEDHFGR